MKDINVTLSGVDMNYKMASQIAHAIAHEINGRDPIVVAWHDKAQSRMSPVIEGGISIRVGTITGKTTEGNWRWISTVNMILFLPTPGNPKAVFPALTSA
jgi:hypothetical protein